MKKYDWEKAKKGLIGDIFRYVEQLKKGKKNPSIKICRQICKNNFGEIFSSMAELLQTVLTDNLKREIQIYLDGECGDKAFIKSIHVHVIDWFYSYLNSQNNKLKLID